MGRVERTALVSVFLNIGLVCLKVFLAAVSGSLALLADAWHSGSDVAASGLVWAGARLSRRRSGSSLAIAENVIGLIIAALILWAAVGIFSKVSALAGEPLKNLPLAIGGSLLAAIVSYYAAQYKLHVGRETGSISLIADGYHSRMDTLTTGAVVVALLGHAIGVQLDRIAAVVVAVFIVESAVEIGTSAVRGLREGTAARADHLADLLGGRTGAVVQGFLERTRLRQAVSALARAARDRRTARLAGAWCALAVLALWALSTVFFVGPGRVAVVTRWGAVRGAPLSPGAHIKAPWPIDRVHSVDVPKVRRVEVGFRARSDGPAMNSAAAEFYATLWESRHAAGTYEKLPEEALRLTGDENIIDMNVVVFFSVSDPEAYLFNVAEPESVVRFSTEAVITTTVGSLDIDDLLTLRRGAYEAALVEAVQVRLDALRSGIRIVGARLQDVHPPLEVVPSFRDVASAREDKNRIINEALAYADETVPLARGEAESLLRRAEGYRAERVSRATGDADRFQAMAAEYRNSKDVTELRLYLETIESLLTGVEKYIVSSDLDLESYDIRFFDEALVSPAGR